MSLNSAQNISDPTNTPFTDDAFASDQIWPFEPEVEDTDANIGADATLDSESFDFDQEFPIVEEPTDEIIAEEDMNETPEIPSSAITSIMDSSGEIAGDVVDMPVESEQTTETAETVNTLTATLKEGLTEGRYFEDRPDLYINKVLADYTANVQELSAEEQDAVREQIKAVIYPEFDNAYIARNVSIDLQKALEDANASEEDVRSYVQAYLNDRQGVTDENRSTIEELTIKRLMKRLEVKKAQASKEPVVQSEVESEPDSISQDSNIITAEQFTVLREEFTRNQAERAANWGARRRAA